MCKKPFHLLLPLFLMALTLSLLTGCGKNSPEQVVKAELNLIQKLDENTIKSFVSYEDMMSTSSTSTDIGEETSEAVQLFFQDFDYKILSSSATDKTATVNVQITNIDAKALAKDVCMTIMKNSVSPDGNDSIPLTMNSYFTLLRDILSENTYELVTNSAHFDLIHTESGWSIQSTEKLEDELVGGFITALHDANLVSPEELVTLTFDALKELSPEEWVSYLNMNDIFATGNQLYRKIDLALATQIETYFDYEIKEVTVDLNKATANVELSSLDLEDVLSKYLDKLLEYAATTEAVRATDVQLSDKTSALLLEALKTNTNSIQRTIAIEFNNNGYNWEMNLGDDFTDALLGSLNDAVQTFQSSSQQ